MKNYQDAILKSESDCAEHVPHSNLNDSNNLSLRKKKNVLTNLFDNKGFTLIELLAVLVILGIILMVAVPVVGDSIEHAESEVCHTNRVGLERMYERGLTLEDNIHSDELFALALAEYEESICTDHGLIRYENGEVVCSVHADGDVPHL